ncbi:GGDEF domain-containing protein [Actinoplanes awajinensis]|uniref:GGDEF domain-containing protein n=1 Tax=Actinoplanes awajinensis TaxID=135946 RepID=UPI000B0BDAEF|nr:GGDEF domain-containing protein [Actinoplanes awajinensis]
MRTAAWKRTLVAGAVTTAGYAVLPASGPWRAILYGISAFTCVALVVVATRRYRPQHPSTWYAIAAGSALWVLSSLILRVTGADPWSLVAGLLSAAGYPLLGWTLVGMIRGRARADGRTVLIDAGILGAGLALLYWTFVIGDTLTDGTVDGGDQLLASLFAVGDISVIVLVSLLVTTPGARTSSYRLMLGALTLTGVSDILVMAAPSGELYQGGPADLTLVLSSFVIAAAALHPSMRRLTVPLDRPPAFVRPRLALLAVAILLAPTVSLYQGATGTISRDWLATGLCSIVLFVLVTLRMVGLVARVESQARTLSVLVNKDPLTGLANRRRWDERLDAALAHGTLTGDPLIVALFDLDHFKRYNDTYGHPAGDELLKDAAVAWRTGLRRDDVLARYGGEEFCLLLTGYSEPEARVVVERLLAVTPYGQTFSAGLARWDGTQSAAELLEKADQLMYASKSAGRAQVTSDFVPAVSDTHTALARHG